MNSFSLSKCITKTARDVVYIGQCCPPNMHITREVNLSLWTHGKKQTNQNEDV